MSTTEGPIPNLTQLLDEIDCDEDLVVVLTDHGRPVVLIMDPELARDPEIATAARELFTPAGPKRPTVAW
jgi:hypothetical protein